MLKCKSCGNKLGWIFYTRCSRRGLNDAVCADIFQIRCWWCGRKYFHGTWFKGEEPTLKNQKIVANAMVELIDLRKIGIDRHNLMGVVGGVITR